MGEWRRVVPHGELSAQVLITIAAGGVLLLSVVQLLTPGQLVGEWWQVTILFLVLGGAIALTWRAARAGVHVGPRGLLLYRAAKRAELVPWDEVVRFEARPLRREDVPVEGAAIYLVGPRGDLRDTGLRRSVGHRWERALNNRLDHVVLYGADFPAAVDQLNEAVRPFTSPR